MECIIPSMYGELWGTLDMYTSTSAQTGMNHQTHQTGSNILRQCACIGALPRALYCACAQRRSRFWFDKRGMRHRVPLNCKLFPFPSVHHRLHLPTPLLWLELWERSLFQIRRGAFRRSDGFLFFKDPFKRRKSTIQHHRIEESVRIWGDFDCSYELYQRGGFWFWEYNTKQGVLHTLETCKKY